MKVALVTGSTSGIGLAIASRLAKASCNIVMNGFGAPDSIAEARKALEAHGAQVLYHGADVSKVSEVEDMVQQAVAQFGRLDIVVNNAGIQHVAPLDDFPAEKWDQIMGINLSGCFYLIKAALPHLRKAEAGRIVNIASVHGIRASPHKAAYVAAKHGLVGLTKAVAVELAAEQAKAGVNSYVTCNAICPGWVSTPLVENQIGQQAEAMGISEAEVKNVLLARQPNRRLADPDEIAAFVEFVCSEPAAGLTGQVLGIDGGWSAC